MRAWAAWAAFLLVAAPVATGQEPATSSEQGSEQPRKPPPVVRLSLRDAVDLGLARNLGLRSARLGALMARIDVAIEEAAWDPTFTGVVTGGETQVPSRSTLAGADVVDTDHFNFALGLQKPTRLGPVLGVDWRSDRVFTNSTFSSINPAYEGFLELSITVPLLRGSGRAVNTAALRSARLVAEKSRLDFQAVAEQVMEAVGIAYWDVVYRRGRVDVLRKSWGVALDVEEAERKKLRSGDGTRVDVMQARAQAKRREADWIGGKREAGDAADRLRSLILPFLGTAGDEVVLEPSDAPAGVQNPPALDKAVQTALARRPELRRADLEVARLNEEITLAEDAAKPQLDLRGAVAGRGVTSDFGSSVRNTLDGSALSANASLTMSQILGRRAAKSALTRSFLDRERAVVARLDTMNTIVVEVRAAHRALTANAQENAAALEEVAAAEESLRGERLRLQRGDSTVLLVNQAEESMTSARLRELQTRVALEGARVVLARVTGVLLQEFGVGFDDDLQAVRASHD